MRPCQKNLRRRRGVALLNVIMLMSVLFSAAALAIDVGRMQLTKARLQDAADAVAMHAAKGLLDDTWSSRAQEAVQDNQVNGSVPTLVSTELDGETVVVRLRATAPMSFMSLFGLDSVNVGAMAGASAPLVSEGGSGVGFLGLDSINMSGNVTIDSYNSATDPPPTPGNGSHKGHSGTNGHMNLNGNIKLYGDAHMFSYQHMTVNGGGGLQSPAERVDLEEAFAPESISTPSSGVTDMGNWNRNNGTIHLSGKYKAMSLNWNSGATIVCDGPVEIYVNGSINIKATITTHENKPANLKIIQVASAGIDLSSSKTYFAQFYNPKGPINVNGSITVYGSVIGKSISVSGGSDFVIDESLDLPGSAGEPTLGPRRLVR